MKKLFILSSLLFLVAVYVQAQDTLYVYRGKAVIAKYATATIDSLTFTPSSASDPYHAHMSVHESAYDFANEVAIPIKFGSEVTIPTPTKVTDEYGFLFISIPADKPFMVLNMFHEDVTAGFLVISPITDNRIGFQNNLIYRDSNAYDISYPTTLIIIIG